MVLAIYFSVLLITIQIFTVNNKKIDLFIDIRKLDFMHEVDDRFLSFTIDSKSLAEHWFHLGLRNKKIISMTKALKPSFLRIGGTDGDNLIFDPDAKPRGVKEESERKQMSAEKGKDKISALDIIRLGKFVLATESELVYGLNVIERKGTGKWDPTNSLKLIRFMDRKGIPVGGWELGNEPNRFPEVFNRTITGEMLSRDFNRLKNIILRFPRYSKSLIIGPDITHVKRKSEATRMLQRFLQHVNNDTLSRISFHHYYFNGRNATVDNYVDAEIMNTLAKTISLVKEKAQTHQAHVPLWIGETSTGYGGGTPNISDRFVSSFTWLDKLGQSAFGGIQVVLRQTLLTQSTNKDPKIPRSWYGLIDVSHNPTPSYFVSYVFKKLVGNRVLNITNALSSMNTHDAKSSQGQKVRVYAHCSRSGPGIVLFGINVDDTMYKIKFVGKNVSKIEEYVLSAPGGDLTSRFIKLNGKHLKVGKDGLPPLLIPRLRRGHSVIRSMTLGFWNFPDLKSESCI